LLPEQPEFRRERGKRQIRGIICYYDSTCLVQSLSNVLRFSKLVRRLLFVKSLIVDHDGGAAAVALPVHRERMRPTLVCQPKQCDWITTEYHRWTCSGFTIICIRPKVRYREMWYSIIVLRRCSCSPFRVQFEVGHGNDSRLFAYNCNMNPK
jgi:hypothetical protein